MLKQKLTSAVVALALLPISLLCLLDIQQAVEARPGDLISYTIRGGADVFRITPGGQTIATNFSCVPEINHHTLLVTSAQLKALHGTPVTMTPVPGTGKDEVLVGPVIVHFSFGTIDYTGGGTNVVQYHTGAVAATTTFANTIIQAGASSEQVLIPVAAVPTVNDTLEFTTGGSNYAAGDGTVTLDWNSRNN